MANIARRACWHLLDNPGTFESVNSHGNLHQFPVHKEMMRDFQPGFQ
jgi:hypothetical protein